MTNNEMWNAPDIVPTITYSDLPRAVEWLQHVFGFRERAEARLTWPGGGMTWIEVGNGLFNISTPDDTWGQGSGAAATGFVLKVYVDDVDKHFRSCKVARSDNHCGAPGWFLGWADLQSLGSRGSPVGDFARWP